MMSVLLMAAPIAFTIRTVRRGIPQVRSVWRAARWYEKAGMCLLFVPIPGPVDEIVALVIMARVSQRIEGGQQ